MHFGRAQIRETLSDGLLTCPESLLTQSMKNEHSLRTPLMAAAASGDYSLFTSVMHAVDRAIDKTAVRCAVRHRVYSSGGRTVGTNGKGAPNSEAFCSQWFKL